MSCVAISIRSAGPRSPASRLKSSCAATRPSLATSCATTVTPGLSMSASSKSSKPANAGPRRAEMTGAEAFLLSRRGNPSSRTRRPSRQRDWAMDRITLQSLSSVSARRTQRIHVRNPE